ESGPAPGARAGRLLRVGFHAAIRAAEFRSPATRSVPDQARPRATNVGSAVLSRPSPQPRAGPSDVRDGLRLVPALSTDAQSLHPGSLTRLAGDAGDGPGPDECASPHEGRPRLLWVLRRDGSRARPVDLDGPPHLRAADSRPPSEVIPLATCERPHGAKYCSYGSGAGRAGGGSREAHTRHP